MRMLSKPDSCELRRREPHRNGPWIHSPRGQSPLLREASAEALLRQTQGGSSWPLPRIGRATPGGEVGERRRRTRHLDQSEGNCTGGPHGAGWREPYALARAYLSSVPCGNSCSAPRPSHSLAMPIFGLVTSLLAQAILAGPPGTPPEALPLASNEVAEFCAPLPSPATISNVVHDHYARTDGTQVVEGSVDYTLSLGERASWSILITDDGYGAAHFEVDGQILVYATFEEGAPESGLRPGSMVETWVSPNISLPAETVAELFQESVTEILFDGLVPQEFKCSAFGRKVMKWAKHLTYGALGAGTAGCCALGSIPGCMLCGGAAGTAGSALGDAFDAHCD
jgi:hypothetical protein